MEFCQAMTQLNDKIVDACRREKSLANLLGTSGRLGILGWYFVLFLGQKHYCYWYYIEIDIITILGDSLSTIQHGGKSKQAFYII